MRTLFFLLFIMSCTCNIFFKRHPYLILIGYRHVQDIKKYIQESKILQLPYIDFSDNDMRRALLLI